MEKKNIYLSFIIIDTKIHLIAQKEIIGRVKLTEGLFHDINRK